jgi:hypothetical protein
MIHLFVKRPALCHVLFNSTQVIGDIRGIEEWEALVRGGKKSFEE